ncbi:hypothetical protein Tco_0888949 [Tanacetum coccineum]
MYLNSVFIQLINTAYSLLLNTAYRSSGTESEPKHFKTLSLDELRSPDFNLLSNQEYSKEEVAETMVETMEQYMSKTRADYGSGVARPKIEDKDNFELKGQFLKELHTNTFNSSDHEDVNEHIEKVLEILDSRGAIPSKTAADARVAIQEMAEYSQKWHNGTSRSRIYAAQVGCEQCKGTHYTKDCPLKEEGKTLEEAYYTQFGGPFQGGGYRAATPGFYQRNNANPSYQERSRLNGYYCEEKKGSYGPQFSKAYSEASRINNSIPRKEKDPGSFTLPCFINNVRFDNALVNLGASVNAMPLLTYLNLGLGELAHTKYAQGYQSALDPRKTIFVYRLCKITLRVGEERIIFTSVKPASSLIKRVYMLSLRERMELDLEARLIGETLVNQGDDLIPTIREGEVIEKFITRDDELDDEINDYPSYCDYDKKIHIDCAHNLKFSCMIGFEFTHAIFFPLLYVNVMSKEFHNSIMKDKMVYKGNNIVGALMNVSIFVGTFSVVMNFAVLENIDSYHDEEMGDVIFGEPLREVGIKTRWFERMITIYNGNDEVTYQMVRSHPRFIHHINEQCNKISPLLKVSEEDKMNGISHPY